jgi:hypothetical protein
MGQNEATAIMMKYLICTRGGEQSRSNNICIMCTNIMHRIALPIFIYHLGSVPQSNVSVIC